MRSRGRAVECECWLWSGSQRMAKRVSPNSRRMNGGSSTMTWLAECSGEGVTLVVVMGAFSVATAPVIKAQEREVSFAVGTITLAGLSLALIQLLGLGGAAPA